MASNGAPYGRAHGAAPGLKAALPAICLIVLTALLQIGLGARGFF